jgi:pyruvate,water dikinase
MGRKDPSGKSAFRPSLKTMRYIPRMLLFLVSNLYLGRVFQRKMVILDKEINALKRMLDEDFSIEQYPGVFLRIRETGEEAAYYNIIIPLAMQILNKRLKKKMDKRGLVYENLDFSSDFPGLRDYDPQYQIQRSVDLWKAIPVEYRKKTKSYDDLEKHTRQEEIVAFKRVFKTLLKKFGHFSESGNDFSYPPWREDPDFLFSMVRQEDGKRSLPADKPGKGSIKRQSRFPGATYRRAGNYRLYREMISSEYTRGYGLFRDLFRHTGKHLAAAGKISQPEDVFLLTLQEHDGLLRGDDLRDYQSIQQKVSKRKQEMKDLENISLPSIIYGEEPPPLARPDEKTLHGIPVSPGVFEGEIVVVRGYKDFEKKVEDAILVIPFSDVGWTPVLARAGAIVSESGGMLSHASIVARELSIPAIASVDHACSMQDGIRARLDGYNGLLIIDK